MAGAAAPAGAAAKAYWYYPNDVYELRSETDVAGVVTPQARSILGPCPRKQVIEIAQGEALIDPMAPAWQETMMARLQAAQFETAGINTAPNNPEMGKTVSSYFQDVESWKIMTKDALKIGVVAVTALVPVATLVGSVVMGIAGAGAGASLYDSFFKNIVYMEHFKEWSRRQVMILTTRNASPFADLMATHPGLYKMIEEDPILGAEGNICSITQEPIRYPVRTPAGHLFEERAIRAWLEHLRIHELPLTDPVDDTPLHLADLTFDVELSDRIELRLLTLEAFYEAENHRTIEVRI